MDTCVVGEKLQDEIGQRVLNAIQRRVFPGCVIGVVNKLGPRSILAYGQHTYEQSSPLMCKDSVFDVASITKFIPTALLTLQLIDQRKLHLDDRISVYLPEITSRSGQVATIRHLLTYTYLLNTGRRLSSFKDLPPENIMHMLFSTETFFSPGDQFQYSNTPSIFLGLILERITGKDLPQLARECLFNPMGMHETSFDTQYFPGERIVPTEQDNWRGTVRGVVHDEVSWALQKSFYPGCAGLFSTADDLLNCMLMLLNCGVYQNKQIISSAVIKNMLTNQLVNIEACHGLGVELNQPQYMGKHAPDMFGKTGFTGTVFLGNQKKGIAVVILSNRCFPTRQSNGDAINQFRADIADLVFSY